MSRKFASLFAAIAFAAVSVAPAMAEPGTRTVSVKVAYSDLDLTQTKDVRTMFFRLKTAVGEACGHPRGIASSTRVRQVKKCRADAMSSAAVAIDAPLLTAFINRGQKTKLASL